MTDITRLENGGQLWCPDDAREVIVCAGPPICLLQGEAAIENSQAGCTSCRHIVITDDGEHEYHKKAH